MEWTHKKATRFEHNGAAGMDSNTAWAQAVVRRLSNAYFDSEWELEILGGTSVGYSLKCKHSNESIFNQPVIAPETVSSPEKSHESFKGDDKSKRKEDKPDAFTRFPAHRKIIMLAVVAYCGMLSPISSTTVLSALPDVSATFKTTGSIISLSNALYLVFMGLSPCCFGPMCQVFGRRSISLTVAVAFLACSIGTALSPNIVAFFVFRMLTAFSGTAFLTSGAAVIGDLFHTTERGTATGWFLAGTLIGPTIGPLLGGVIATYSSWRDIFWLQTGLGGGAILGVYFLQPETLLDSKKLAKFKEQPTTTRKVTYLWSVTNPVHVVKLLRFPNLLLAAVASGSIFWNQYGLLTPIRYVLNPRFNLDSPMQSGLFYLAPGLGSLAGTLVGGRWADFIVRKWIQERGGKRVAEDRLRSCILFLTAVQPACMLVYGWSVEQKVGGIPLPVIAMFFNGVAQSFSFPSVNTYLLDVIPGRSAEVTAGNHLVRYLFGALTTAIVLPAVESISVGWWSTICATVLVAAGLGIAAVTRWGTVWRESIIKKQEQKG